MGSIRNRLAVYILLGMAVLLITAGAVIDYLLREQLQQEFDRNLLAKAMTLVTLTDQESGEVEFDFADEFMPEFSAADRPEYFQLWLSDGTEFGRSRSLRDLDMPRSEPTTEEPLFTDLALGDGRLLRMVSFAFIPRSDEGDEEEPADTIEGDEGGGGEPGLSSSRVEARIAVARGREDLHQLLATIRTTLLATFATLMASVALLVHFSLRQGLLPLRRIAEQVSGLDATKLQTRLDSPADSEELVPIISQLNHLLERLDEAFQREQRFSGNIAHELRTPIAELRAMAEIGERWPADEQMVKMFFNALVGLAGDMEKTVTNLLTIARLEAGKQVVETDTFSLRELADETWKHIATEAEAKGISFENHVDADFIVTTDKDKLTLILNNLLSNAVNYSPPDSRTSIEAKADEEGVAFSISNPAPDLSQRDLPMMFERFWRKDQARTGAHHVGLGLSVIKALAEILELVVHPRLDTGGSLTMTVSGLQPA